MTPVRLEPAALRSRVKHSTTEPLRSPGVWSVIRLFHQTMIANDINEHKFHTYFLKVLELGDNCIQNFHLGRYIVGYRVAN